VINTQIISDGAVFEDMLVDEGAVGRNVDTITDYLSGYVYFLGVFDSSLSIQELQYKVSNYRDYQCWSQQIGVAPLVINVISLSRPVLTLVFRVF
jgi:hypothetical protein